MSPVSTRGSSGLQTSRGRNLESGTEVFLKDQRGSDILIRNGSFMERGVMQQLMASQNQRPLTERPNTNLQQ